MKLIKEVEKQAEVDTQPVESAVVPEGGWSVGHLANHGMLLSCDGFVLKLDLDQLNALFDLAEGGESGEIRDHAGDAVYVEVNDDSIILSRDGDKTYPNGVVLDLDTLKEMGIEQHTDDQAEAAMDDDEGSHPEEEAEGAEDGDTIDSEELEEGVKRAFRRVGKKIKRGFRVTSGFRKGRVVSSAKAAFKPRAKAKTRMKLRVAAKRKKIVRILKGKITRRKSVSKRLRKMNARLK